MSRSGRDRARRLHRLSIDITAPQLHHIPAADASPREPTFSPPMVRAPSKRWNPARRCTPATWRRANGSSRRFSSGNRSHYTGDMVTIRLGASGDPGHREPSLLRHARQEAFLSTASWGCTGRGTRGGAKRGRWVEARDLRVGDVLKARSGDAADHRPDKPAGNDQGVQPLRRRPAQLRRVSEQACSSTTKGRARKQPSASLTPSGHGLRNGHAGTLQGEHPGRGRCIRSHGLAQDKRVSGESLCQHGPRLLRPPAMGLCRGQAQPE